MNKRTFTRGSGWLLAAGILALGLAGCGFKFGGSGASGFAGSSGFSSANFFNCSDYGFTVYRTVHTDTQQIGSSATYAIGGSCDQSNATPVAVDFVDGETNYIEILFTNGTCLDNPGAPGHCPSRSYTYLGDADGKVEDVTVQFP